MINGITKCSKCNDKADALEGSIPYCAKHWFHYVAKGLQDVDRMSGMRRGREMRIRSRSSGSDGLARGVARRPYDGV